jgi:hypothetical protein
MRGIGLVWSITIRSNYTTRILVEMRDFTTAESTAFWVILDKYNCNNVFIVAVIVDKSFQTFELYRTRWFFSICLLIWRFINGKILLGCWCGLMGWLSKSNHHIHRHRGIKKWDCILIPYILSLLLLVFCWDPLSSTDTWHVAFGL